MNNVLTLKEPEVVVAFSWTDVFQWDRQGRGDRPEGLLASTASLEQDGR